MRPRSCPFEQAVSKRRLPRLGRCCHAARTQSGDPKMVVIPAPRSVRHCGTRELILPTSSQTAVSIDVIGCVGAVVEPGEVVLLERNNLFLSRENQLLRMQLTLPVHRRGPDALVVPVPVGDVPRDELQQTQPHLLGNESETMSLRHHEPPVLLVARVPGSQRTNVYLADTLDPQGRDLNIATRRHAHQLPANVNRIADVLKCLATVDEVEMLVRERQLLIADVEPMPCILAEALWIVPNPSAATSGLVRQHVDNVIGTRKGLPPAANVKDQVIVPDALEDRLDVLGMWVREPDEVCHP